MGLLSDLFSSLGISAPVNPTLQGNAVVGPGRVGTSLVSGAPVATPSDYARYSSNPSSYAKFAFARQTEYYQANPDKLRTVVDFTPAQGAKARFAPVGAPSNTSLWNTKLREAVFGSATPELIHQSAGWKGDTNALSYSNPAANIPRPLSPLPTADKGPKLSFNTSNLKAK